MQYEDPDGNIIQVQAAVPKEEIASSIRARSQGVVRGSRDIEGDLGILLDSSASTASQDELNRSLQDANISTRAEPKATEPSC